MMLEICSNRRLVFFIPFSATHPHKKEGVGGGEGNKKIPFGGHSFEIKKII